MHPDQPDAAARGARARLLLRGSFAAWGLLVAGGFGGAHAASSPTACGRATAKAALDRGEPGAAARPHSRCSATTPPPAGPTRPLARDFARDLLESVEPYGILITAGDNDTFPLWYAQEVEGIRPDVTLANLSLMNTRWHLRQLRRRPTPEFDPSTSVALWGSDTSAAPAGGKSVQRWTHPTEPVFGFTEAQLDSLPEYMQVPEGRGAAGGQRADPLRRRLPHAAGPRRRRHHPAEPRQAADLLLLERRWVSRPDAGPEPVPGDAGDGPEAHDRPGHHHQRFTGGQPGAWPDGLSAHRATSCGTSITGRRSRARGRADGSIRRRRRSCSSMRCSIADWRRRCAPRGTSRRPRTADSIAQAIRINLQPIH